MAWLRNVLAISSAPIALLICGCAPDESSADGHVPGGHSTDGKTAAQVVALPAGRKVDLLEPISGGGLWVLSHVPDVDGKATFFAQRLRDDASTQCEATVGAFYPGWSNYGVAPDGALVFGARPGDSTDLYRAVRFDASSCSEAEWFVDPAFDAYSVNLAGPVAVTESAMFFAGAPTSGDVLVEQVKDGATTNRRKIEPQWGTDSLGDRLEVELLGVPRRLANGKVAYTAAHSYGSKIQMALVDPETATVDVSKARLTTLTDRSAVSATILPQTSGGFVTVVGSFQQSSDIRQPRRSFLSVLPFDLADDDPIAAWQNLTLSYPPADGTMVPRLDTSVVLAADGWLAAGSDGRSGLETGAFSVDYAALRVTETPSATRRTVGVEVPNNPAGVKSVRLAPVSGSVVTHAVRTESAAVVLALWVPKGTPRIAGKEHSATEAGAVLVMASSPAAFAGLESEGDAAPTCRMSSDACFECARSAITDAACLGRDATCTRLLVASPACACAVQNADADDAAGVDACFSDLATSNAGGTLTARAVLETCGDVCR